MEDLVSSHSGWRGRRVFLTGHTGFKGGWLALWLSALGAQVRGYALPPEGAPNLFNSLRLGECVEDMRGDIRDAAALEPALREFAPEVVFHLAAQPLVRASYHDPIGTYETNVLGTARVLDAVRRTPSVRAVVSVTTDKVYENRETLTAYRESDPLGGYDPYSSSKACAELVTAAYRQSYRLPAVTARAGNVIGGGDWSTGRLLPDLVRGFLSGEPVAIRHPHAIRPWQHVLDPLHGYLLLAEKVLAGEPPSCAYNFGPAETDARPVSWIADHMARSWGGAATWVRDEAPSVHEAGFLKLDAGRAREELHWTPRLDLPTALDWLIAWYRRQAEGAEMRAFTLEQIRAYERLSG